MSRRSQKESLEPMGTTPFLVSGLSRRLWHDRGLLRYA
jgi:hypothetical protein